MSFVLALHPMPLPTFAANTCRRCVQLGGLWQIAIGCGTCVVSVLGRCFESCDDYEHTRKQLKVCRTHKSCRVCIDAGCDWYPKGGGKCTVDYGQSMAFADSCPNDNMATTSPVRVIQLTTPPTTTTTTPRTHVSCTQCGANNNQLSCCHRDGSWYGKCGDPGDTSYAHTWDEGIEECRGTRFMVCSTSIASA